MRDRWLPIAVVLIALFSFGFGLDWAPLFDKDEGAFAEATREMVTSGNYLMTYLNGAPRYDKPILIYWFQAASVHVFGLSAFAVRLPSALAALVWAALLWAFVRRQDGARTAWLSVLILVTALQITVVAKAAIADALLNACIAGTMFAIWRFHETQERRFLLTAFAAMALGALTKGPIALYVPLVTTLIFAWRQGQLRAWPKQAFHPLGIALFLIIALPWPIAAFLDQGMPLLQDWFQKQTVDRMGSSLEGHSGSIFYYVPVLLVGLMPWTPLFLADLRQLRSQWRDPFRQFCWIWFLAVFVLFSLMGTKLPHYLIYGYTPLCILMARRLESYPARRLSLAAAGLAAIILLVPLFAPTFMPLIKDAYAHRVFSESLGMFTMRYYAPVAAALLVFVALAAAAPRLPRTASALLLGTTMAALVNLHLLPFTGAITQEPIRQAALLAKREGWQVVRWDLNMPSFMFYREALVTDGLAKPGEILLTKITELEKMYDQYDVLFYDKGIVLARVHHVKGAI